MFVKDYMKFSWFLLLLFLFNYFFLLDQGVVAKNEEGDRCIRTVDNLFGTCKKLENCPKTFDDYTKYKIDPDFCSYSASLVCCPDIFVGEISSKKCEEYEEWSKTTATVSVLTLKPNPMNVTSYSDYCLTSKPLILNGENATFGEFPSIAVLGYQNNETGRVDWRCGGTLISEEFVLTAGHCIERSLTIVRLGELDLDPNNKDDAQHIDYGISSIISHPEYKRASFHNDIALIKLRNRVQFREYIWPACLWTAANPPIITTVVVAAGWGKTDYDAYRSSRLLKAGLGLFSNQQCQEIFSTRKIISSQMCAGSEGKDTCIGDSGGPLYIKLEDNPCSQYLFGITSFGLHCSGSKPSIYTRVSSYIDWIESNVWPQ